MRCSLDISGITSSSPVASSVKPCSLLASSSRLKKYLHRIIHPLKLLLNQQWEAFSGTSRVPAFGFLHLIFILCYFISISVPAAVKNLFEHPLALFIALSTFSDTVFVVSREESTVLFLETTGTEGFTATFTGSFSSVLFTVFNRFLQGAESEQKASLLRAFVRCSDSLVYRQMRAVKLCKLLCIHSEACFSCRSYTCCKK